MAIILAQLTSWLGYLERPAVLLQLLPQVLLLVTLLLWRRRRAALPLPLLLLAGQSLILLLLWAAGQRSGLVLLLQQLVLAWALLRLLERRLLMRLLAARPRQILVSRLLRPGLLVVALLTLLDALGSLADLASLPLGVWFGSAISLGRLCGVLAVLYLLLVGLELPASVLSDLMRRTLGLSEGSRRALDLILRYVFVTLGLVWAMARLGINQTGVLAIAGGLSVGLGFGIKEVVSNIISGLWLLIEGSVRPGDVLLHDGETCEVRRLGPRATTLLRSVDNAELVVPNQFFFTSTTITYTGSDHNRCCSLEFSVAQSLSPERVQTLLVSLAVSHRDVLARPAPEALLLDHGAADNRFGLTLTIADPLRAAA
ncbi:MAG: mechanosensitive ion channel domain-containing protein, partial [Synechococcaceae cyanobacterium]|nr:mechanosensitive ion channel domain-containing protein [Synechococcaceae cyanobacterium]